MCMKKIGNHHILERKAAFTFREFRLTNELCREKNAFGYVRFAKQQAKAFGLYTFDTFVKDPESQRLNQYVQF